MASPGVAARDAGVRPVGVPEEPHQLEGHPRSAALIRDTNPYDSDKHASPSRPTSIPARRAACRSLRIPYAPLRQRLTGRTIVVASHHQRQRLARGCREQPCLGSATTASWQPPRRARLRDRISGRRPRLARPGRPRPRPRGRPSSWPTAADVPPPRPLWRRHSDTQWAAVCSG
jgi:hypothetical protein